MPDIRGIWVSSDEVSKVLAALRGMDAGLRKAWLKVAHGHGHLPEVANGIPVARGMISDEVKAIIMAYVAHNGSLRSKPE